MFGAIWLAWMAVWIWMLIDCAQREHFNSIQGESAKLLWLLIIFFGGIFGTGAYYFLEKRTDTRTRYSTKQRPTTPG